MAIYNNYDCARVDGNRQCDCARVDGNRQCDCAKIDGDNNFLWLCNNKLLYNVIALRLMVSNYVQYDCGRVHSNKLKVC